MTVVALVVLGTWVCLTVLGAAVLSVCPPRLARELLPAAPVVGALLAVVVLHGTAWWLPVRHGVWFLVAVLAVLVALGVRVRDHRRRPARGDLTALLLGALAGTAPLVLALQPLLASDGVLVHPGRNNDAYYYVSVADWVVDEQGDELPDIGEGPADSDDSVAYGPARALITQHLRIGESLLQAALSVVGRADPTTLWYPLTSLWLGLLPGAVVAAFRLLRLGTVPGVLAGVLVGLAPLGLHQVLNQNSASTLGLAMAPLVLALLAVRITERGRVPLWLVALALVGWVGTYTEYLVLGVPAGAGMVLLQPWRRIGPAVVDGLRIVGLALLLGPFVWWNAVQSLLFLGGLPPDTAASSPYLRVTGGELLNRLTMASGVEGGQGSVAVAVVLAVLLVAGLSAAVARLRGPARGMVVGLVVGALLAYLAYSVGEGARPYTQQRLVALALPLLVLFAAVGWRTLAAPRPRRGAAAGRTGSTAAARRPAAVGTVAALLAWGFGTVVYAAVDREVVAANLAAGREVDGSFREAAGWVDRLGGADGADVTVLTQAFHGQLWLADALREYPDVSYPSLDVSYFGRTSFWSGERDRYLLVDPTVWLDTDPAAVVAANERFLLVDTEVSPVVATVLLSSPPYRWNGAEPGPSSWMADDGEIFVWRSEDAPRDVRLEVRATAELAPTRLVTRLVSRDGSPVAAAPVLAEASVGEEVVAVRVPLPADTVGAVLLLDNLDPAVPDPTTAGSRQVSLQLLDVGGAG